MIRRSLALAVGALLVLAGCGGSPSSPTKPAAAQVTPEPAGSSDAASGGPAAPPASSAQPGPSSTKAAKAAAGTGKYVFPVVGNASYARTHHDYPATDIMAPCGATALS